MSKKQNKITFYCKECGYESAKWLGQCPSCNMWNTFVEADNFSDAVSNSLGITKVAETIEPKSLDSI